MSIDDSLINTHFAVQKKYLNDRGISPEDAGVEFVTELKLRELGYELKHIDKAILWAIRDQFGEDTGAVGARIWYKSEFGIQHKGPKFAPPKDQVPRLYFSPIRKWSKLKKNTTIVLCESYLKADLLCKLGYYAVGVSGCWGWSYKQIINPDFKTLPWKDLGLKFVVSFDSNVGEGRKAELNLAVARLATEMGRLGVKTYLSQLPPPDSGDWGIDDFFMHNKTNLGEVIAKERIHELFEEDKLVEVEGDVVQHLRILNREVAYVSSIDRIVRLNDPHYPPMTANTFKTAAYANRVHWATDEKGKHKKIRLATEWLEWSEMHRLKNIVYRPGKERTHNGDFNVWDGWGCSPEYNGDWEDLWVDWLELAFPAECDRHWFCCWFAVQLQDPGIKLATALAMLGESGVGKGWVAAIMRRIFSDRNCSSIHLSDIGGGFNSDYAAKQLVIVEEASLPERNGGLKDKMKDLITNTKLRVNTKGVPAYEIDNHVNLLLQSNNIDALQLDSFDRRYAVFDIVNPALSRGGDSFWALRWEALTLGLPEAIMLWLLEYDTKDFDPFGTAPDTAVKKVVYETGLTARELFVADLMSNPDAMLPDKAKLYTSAQLEYLYQGTGEDPSPGQVRAMGNTLSTSRVAQVRKPNGDAHNMRGPDGKNNRWWIIRTDMPSGLDTHEMKDHMSTVNMPTIKESKQ